MQPDSENISPVSNAPYIPDRNLFIARPRDSRPSANRKPLCTRSPSCLGRFRETLKLLGTRSLSCTGGVREVVNWGIRLSGDRGGSSEWAVFFSHSPPCLVYIYTYTSFCCVYIFYIIFFSSYSCLIKLNLDCDYNFPIDLAPRRFSFGFKSIG